MSKNAKQNSIDVVVPIVFPDYVVAEVREPVVVDVPDILTDLGLAPDKLRIQLRDYISLGHAGVLLIDGSNGVTKYFEFGRYDPKKRGRVRRRVVTNVALGPAGRPTKRSLTRTLSDISHQAGQGGRVQGVYVEKSKKHPSIDYTKLLTYLQEKKRQYDGAGSDEAELYRRDTNNCMHFVKRTLEAAGVDTPWLLDPRPVSYIAELTEEFPTIGYEPKTSTLESSLRFE